MIPTVLASAGELAGPITWTLIHSLWQGAVIASALFVALALLRRRSAGARYNLSCIALLGLFCLSLATAVRLMASNPTPILQTRFDVARPPSAPVDREERADPSEQTPATFESTLVSWVALCWLIGVTALSLYHVLGWRWAIGWTRSGTVEASPPWRRRLERIRERVGVERAVRMLESAAVRVPCVVGWLRPVVLVPASALSGLSATQLEMILAHELAHIRRHDVLVNYVQTAVETLLFHNPAAWWISRRIRMEREHCCDEIAAEAGGNRLLYARALLEMEGLRTKDPSLSMAADGASLMERIGRLVGKPIRRSHLPAVGVLNVLVLALLLTAGLVSLDCRTSRAAASHMIPTPQTQQPARGDIEGEWAIEPDRDARIRLMMRRGPRSHMGFFIRPNELQGLTAGPNRTFRLVRDAGTFHFEGDVQARGGSYTGSGHWFFTPSASYTQELEKLGFETPSRDKSLELAIHDVRLDFVRGLDRLGYRGFSLSKLVELHIHDVSPEYIQELADLGYEDLSLNKLVEMRIHDVEPSTIRALNDLGYRNLNASKLVEMHIHDVDPGYIRALNELGYSDLSASKLVEMRIHDVDPEYIRALNELDYRNVSASKLVEMRIHDVDPGYIRALNELGYRDLSASKLVEMRIHDVTPDFIRKLRERGYEDLTPDRIIEIKIRNR